MLTQHLKLTTATGALIAMTLGGAALGEDSLPRFAVDCRASCAVVNPATNFLPRRAGATLVINIAHLAPAPEEAFINQIPVECGAIKFRVDTLAVDARKGEVEVSFGERLTLEPGGVMQLVERVDRKGATVGELDLLGYRFRSESPTTRCSLVASGLYYAQDGAMPIPFSLLPGSGLARN